MQLFQLKTWSLSLGQEMTAEQYKGRQIHPERSRVVRNYSGLCGLQLACRLGAQRKPLPVAQEVPQRTANVAPDNSDGVCVCVCGPSEHRLYLATCWNLSKSFLKNTNASKYQNPTPRILI